ncbi:MAG: DUF1080 domain-containing protein [Bryobacterales bacterium]
MLYTSERMIVSRRALLASATAPFLLGKAFSAKAVQLFDGRTLDGWTRHGGGIWTVEDGEIVGRFDRSNPGAGYLMTVGEYEDFVFELEVLDRQGRQLRCLHSRAQAGVDQQGQTAAGARRPRRL